MTTLKNTDLENTLNAICELELQHGFKGVCFSKKSEFPPQSEQKSFEYVRTEDVAHLVHDCMVAALEADELEKTTEFLEPQS